MNADERRKNYHWNESNISEWFQTKIEEELVKRKYEIIKLDVYVKICSRMNNLGLVYTISIDAMKDGKSCFLENFTSTSEENEGLKAFSWFVSFFKEIEAQAILQFSTNVLEIGEKKERSFVGIPEIKAEMKKTGEFKYTSLINASISELIEFMTNKEYIRMWSGSSCVDEKEIRIAIICIYDLSVKDNVISMNFKLETWKEYSIVKIKLSEIRNDTKIEIIQKGIPLEDINVMHGLWKEKIILPICMTFGFNERPFD